jgi:hypothetical protein
MAIFHANGMRLIARGPAMSVSSSHTKDGATRAGYPPLRGDHRVIDQPRSGPGAPGRRRLAAPPVAVVVVSLVMFSAVVSIGGRVGVGPAVTHGLSTAFDRSIARIEGGLAPLTERYVSERLGSSSALGSPGLDPSGDPATVLGGARDPYPPRTAPPLAVRPGVAACVTSSRSNDGFADSALITSIPCEHRMSTRQATTERNEPQPDTECRRSARTLAIGGFGATVWYRLQATRAQRLSIDTFGSGYDTALAVWTGNDIRSLTQVTCSGDTANAQSRVALETTPGTTYFIQVGGSGGSSGDLVFRVAPAELASNDLYAHAAVVDGLPYADRRDTSDATVEQGEPACAGETEPHTIWYSFRSPIDRLVEVSFAGSGFIPPAGVYEASATLGGLTLVSGCNNPTAERVGFAAKAGKRYVLRVSGLGGDVSIRWYQGERPTNDSRAAAIGLRGFPVEVPVNTINASVEADEPASTCGNRPAATSWFRWVPDATTLVIADLPAVDFTPVLAVYQETAAGILSPLGCHDGRILDRTPVPFVAAVGQSYLIQVGARTPPDTAQGAGTARLRLALA